jgi:hypothetical protein
VDTFKDRFILKGAGADVDGAVLSMEQNDSATKAQME